MSKHTPGPWQINLDPKTSNVDGEKLSIQSENMYIAQVDECLAQKANAALIAAAPDLLGALESFPGFMCGTHAGDAWIDQMKEAIARAKGEA